MDTVTPEELLKHVMSADEDVSIPRKTVDILAREELIVVRGCSDGDYIEMTEAGRAALAKRET